MIFPILYYRHLRQLFAWHAHDSSARTVAPRPRVHRLTDLVIFNNCLHLIATSSPPPEKIVLDTLLSACSPDANVVIFQQGSNSGFLHVRKRLDFRFPPSLGRAQLTDVDAFWARSVPLDRALNKFKII